jgi:hypothetical protein
MGKAQEHEFDELHNLVTRELTDRIRKGEDCSTADIKAAIDWLSKNNVTGVASAGTALKELADSLTEEDQAFLERMIQ